MFFGYKCFGALVLTTSSLPVLQIQCPQNGSKNIPILFTGGLDLIRKEAWLFYRTSSGVRLCWEFEEAKGPQGPHSLIGIALEGPF